MESDEERDLLRILAVLLARADGRIEISDRDLVNARFRGVEVRRDLERQCYVIQVAP